MTDYILKSKTLKMVLSTDKDILDAIEESIVKNEIKMSELGQMIFIIHPDGENRPVATIPFLFGRGIVDKETAIQNISAMFNNSLKEAEEMLLNHPLSKRYKGE